MPSFDDVVGIVTLVVCVVAVFMARRGARKKWGEQYARGQADAKAAARSAASVVIGDVTYGRQGGSATAGHVGAPHITAHYDRADDHQFDSDDNEFDALPEPLRHARLSDGVGHVRNLEVGPAIGELPRGELVDRGAAARRSARVVRLARPRSLSAEGRES